MSAWFRLRMAGGITTCGWRSLSACGRSMETGIAGLSIEDRTGQVLYPLPLAVERVAAARQAMDQSGQNVLLVGRTEGWLVGNPPPWTTPSGGWSPTRRPGRTACTPQGSPTSPRSERSSPPSRPDPSTCCSVPGMKVAELAAAGVRRVSVGGALAAAAWAAFDAAARLVRDEGRLP